MATLREENAFTSPIYRLDRMDPLMGGELGYNNRQAQQLANRTQYLLTRLLAEHDATGKHLFTEEQVRTAAHIAESKLKLDVSTNELFSNILDSQELLATLLLSLDLVQNLDQSKFSHIYQALLLSWKYGFPRFAFEMFNESFTFATHFNPVNIIETIAGDDSIDVADSSQVLPNDSYVIWDSNNNLYTPVTVKKVLSNKRVILYKDQDISRASGLLTKMAWVLEDGVAHAEPNSIYITKTIDLFEDYDRGTIVITHYNPAQFLVEYRRPKSTKWLPLALASSIYSEVMGMYRSIYEAPGGSFAIRITAITSAVIPHIICMSDVSGRLNSTVRTPVIVDQDFTLVRFGAVYDAKHVKTTFELSKDTNFSSGPITTLEYGPNDNVHPVWNYWGDIMIDYPMEDGEEVYWRACYTADDGYTSRWSQVGHYIKGADDA